MAGTPATCTGARGWPPRWNGGPGTSRAAAGRAQRRLRMVLAAVAALLLVAIAGGVVALDQRSTARNQARVAEAERLGVQALTAQSLDRSLLLARQGVELDDSPATRSYLLAALL